MKRDQRRLIAVASGFQTKNARSNGSLKILSWGFRNTDTFQISKKMKQFSSKIVVRKKKLILKVKQKKIFF